MKVFQNDDAAFLDWIARHPQGLVLNARKKPDPNYIVLHQANCPSVRMSVPQGGFTERAYIKVCDNSVEPLREWAQARGRHDGSFSRICSRCAPPV